MGVELGVGRARGAVGERGGDEALGVDLVHAAPAASGEGGVVLEEPERLLHRDPVRRQHRGVLDIGAEGPEHRD